ncbi:YdcF family protein [Kroppenstedtia pulmonis]|uniref:YdcF family protein n=1 Tax=Kroppenstedtia pulmonis TaxID=1380685 RepID=A0A7D3XHV9_9BACL|nr:YdcF family protein [Kroppenstedtia pulmonis]QKG83984.1 YdcF family protein [Kroppenstedtia pulmonis]
MLGAALWNNRPSPALQERLDQAHTLYRNGQVKAILLTGGNGRGKLTEAEAMKRYLLAQGVTEEVIFLETKAKNTRENLLYSQGVLLDNRWHSAFVITHDYHQYRSMIHARQVGIKATPSPVPIEARFTLFRKSREVVALWKMWIRGQ